MKRIPITYKGKDYPSIRNFCIQNGYNYRLILQRMQSGKTLEDAIKNNDINIVNGKEVYYKGVYYPSITNLCNTYNIKVATVQGRLKNGWSLEDAIEKKIRKVKKRTPDKLEYKGKTYNTLKELCEDLGVNYTNTSTRLRRGYSFIEAIEKPSQPANLPRECNYKGKYYPSEKALCLEYNCSYTSFIKYRKEGLSLEDALKKSVKKNKEVIIDGVSYPSLTIASRKTGLTITQITYRCKSKNYQNYQSEKYEKND